MGTDTFTEKRDIITDQREVLIMIHPRSQNQRITISMLSLSPRMTHQEIKEALVQNLLQSQNLRIMIPLLRLSPRMTHQEKKEALVQNLLQSQNLRRISIPTQSPSPRMK